MHPARQIRLVACVLMLVSSVPGLRAGAAATAAPQGRRRQVPTRAERKPEGEKGPAFSATAAWTANLPSPPAGQPAYDATHAYVALESGEVSAVSLLDGTVAWSVTLQTAGSLAAGDGLVFVPVAGAIEARDANSGRLRWRSPLEGRLSAPLVWDNGWLLAGTDRGAAVMYRAATGAVLWQKALAAPMRDRAAMTGERVYVGLENGDVLALALSSGQPIWDRALNARPITLAPLDDRVFVGADDKFLYCLSAKNGKRMWRWRTGGPIIGIPIFDKDNVYFLSLDNVLRALDRGNGHQVWQTGLAFRPAAGPFLSDRVLLVCGLSELRGFHVKDGSEAGGTEPGAVLTAPPHFLEEGEEAAAPFILFTREGHVIRMVPSGGVLPSKPFPAKMVYPFWSAADESEASGLKSEVRSVKSEVSSLKSEVSSLKSQVRSPKSQVRSLESSDLRLLTCDFRLVTSDL